MSFSVNYSLFRGEVLAVVGKDFEPVVLIKCSYSFEKLKDGSLFEQNMTFKIPCCSYSSALKVAKFISNRFDDGNSVFFSGTFPKDNFVTVLTPCEVFLTDVEKNEKSL